MPRPLSVATPRVVAPPTTPQRGPAHAAWPRPSAWGRPPAAPPPAPRDVAALVLGDRWALGNDRCGRWLGAFPRRVVTSSSKARALRRAAAGMVARRWPRPAPRSPVRGKTARSGGRRAVQRGAAGRFCRGPPVNSSCFGGVSACHCCSLLLCHRRQLIKERARPDPIKLLWTLKSEAHVIFTCHEIFVLVKCKTILSSLAVNKLKQAVFLTQCPLSGSSICCRHVD